MLCPEASLKGRNFTLKLRAFDIQIGQTALNPRQLRLNVASVSHLRFPP